MDLATEVIETLQPAPPPFDAAVRVEAVTKQFGDVKAVDAVSLVIRRRELFTLLGPSGSGKTTVLRMIAGLLHPSEGAIWIGDREVSSQPTYRRNVGMVFQSLALFPHLDVFGNIAFPLRMRKVGRREQARRVSAALDVVRLPHIAERRINELSGGQQQRVALARALVYEPELLLLDEPFGALDLKLREEMQLEIVRLHHEIDVTIVNVTHDQREALMLSDRVGVMKDGKLEQVGESEEVYVRPATPFVGQFIGNTNAIKGEYSRAGGGDAVTVAAAAIPVARGVGLPEGAQVWVILRAEAAKIATPDEAGSFPFALAGTVSLSAFQGNAIQYEVAVPALGTTLRIEADPKGATRRFAIGDAVCVTWDPEDAPVVAD